MTEPTVVTIGESMGLLSPERVGRLPEGGPFRLGFGGSESNVAIGLARLGVRAKWIGRVGDDAVGSMIVDRLAREGVDTTAVARDANRSTGLMIREHRSGIDTRVHYVRRGSAGSALSAADVPRLEPGDHLHVSGITPALSLGAAGLVDGAIKHAVSVGATVSFDANYRAALWTREQAAAVIGSLAMRATIVFASADELDLLAVGGASDVVGRLLAAGVDTVIVKHGPDGARLRQRNIDLIEPGRSVPVTDPVGAGDAFVAGYLAAWRDGHSPAAALETAVLASAHAVTVPGDFEGMPTWDDLDRIRRWSGTGDVRR